MRILNWLLVAAACSVLLLIAYFAEPADSKWEPNPMKSNQAQHTRVQQEVRGLDLK